MTEPARFDPMQLLLCRWRVLAIGAFVGALAATGYALLTPDWYSATLAVVPSQRGQDSAASAIASKLPGALDSFQTDVQRIEAVLVSTSVTDAVIDKFKLKDRYGTTHIEHARKALWSHCSTSSDRKAGLVTLTCEDKDPTTAMNIAEYFGQAGNQVFGRVSGSSAHEERVFLEAQVVRARNDVDDASRKLREFQEAHKILDLPEQTKAVISAMAQLKGEMLSKELELSYIRGFSSSGESSVVQLQQQVAVMESRLHELEHSGRGSATTGDGSAGSAQSFFPDAMSVPELRFELEELMREQKIRETVFGLLTERLEMAKVNEARDTSTFQILDHPTLPTFKSRPNRKKFVLIGFACGGALAAAMLLLPPWFRRRFRPAADV